MVHVLQCLCLQNPALKRIGGISPALAHLLVASCPLSPCVYPPSPAQAKKELLIPTKEQAARPRPRSSHVAQNLRRKTTGYHLALFSSKPSWSARSSSSSSFRDQALCLPGRGLRKSASPVSKACRDKVLRGRDRRKIMVGGLKVEIPLRRVWARVEQYRLPGGACKRSEEARRRDDEDEGKRSEKSEISTNVLFGRCDSRN